MRGALAIGLWMGAALVSPGCDESLPPRDDPQGYLHASLSVEGGVVTVAGDGSISRGGALTVGVTNSHDEVLQAEASVLVDVEVWMRDAPDRYALAQLDERNLVTAWLVRGGLTTLPPGSTGRLAGQWSHRTVSGEPFWNFVQQRQKIGKNGVPFMESDPVVLEAQASVRLFKGIAPIQTSRVQFTLVYQIFPE